MKSMSVFVDPFSCLAHNGVWPLISGTHGLRSDIRDITNHIENLSLSELLNGTYKYSSLGREKGKKVLRTKDELLVSVRKAFSMLSGRDSYSKDPNFLLSPKLPTASTSSCDGKDQCTDKPMKVTEMINVLIWIVVIIMFSSLTLTECNYSGPFTNGGLWFHNSLSKRYPKPFNTSPRTGSRLSFITWLWEFCCS